MTIQQTINKIKKLDTLLATQANKILLTPTRGLEGIMKERIFIFGINSDDNPIGIGYSKLWGYIRQKKGLQTDFVDMKFSGRLKKNMTTKVADKDTVVIMIDNDFDYKNKAIKQEDLREFYIFKPTEDEASVLEGFVEKALEFQIEKIFV
jgi:hypothetical protein